MYELEHRTPGSSYLQVPFEIKQINEDGVFEGYASVFGVLDDQGDIVISGAFAATIAAKGADGIRMLWQHHPHFPIGTWLDLKEDERGLLVRGQLVLVGKGEEAHALLKAKALRGLSFGYSAKKSEHDDENGIRRLIEVELWEISLVTFPANLQAGVTGVKTVVGFQNLSLGDRGAPWNRPRAQTRVRSWAGAKDAPNAKYRGAFVWYDRGSADNFGAYKLQVADVIGGELKAMPRGVFAAAGVMMGARGGVDMPDGERAGVRGHLGRYYAKMRREWDDDAIVPPWDKALAPADSLKAVMRSMADVIETEREFEAFLHDCGYSQQEAKAIVADGYGAAVSPHRDGDGEHNAVERIRRLTSSLATTG